MSGYSEFQLKSILKSTEELVTQARLNDIAREHQSIGSILDNRCLYALEVPKKRDRTQSKLEIEKRLHSRRGGRGESDIKAKADQALESFKDRGVNVEMLIGNYAIEQAIWKEKSSQMSYSQKRKYQYPELQRFKDSMTGIQRNIFKEKISEAIIALADRYRAECQAMKADMDLNGVFHPEANAHRVHCIYLMKLHKGIRSETIEDPILRRLLAEKGELARGLQEEEARKERLVQMIESANGAPINKSELAAAIIEEELSAAPRVSAIPKRLQPGGNPSLKLSRRTGVETDTAVTVKNTSLRKSASQPLKHTRQLEPIVAGRNRAQKVERLSSEKRASHVDAGGQSSPLRIRTRGEADDDDDDDQQSLKAGSAETANVLGTAKSPGPADDKIFKRMKRDRLGAADARTVLAEEASRLEKGEVVASRKTRDKNTLLDTETSAWMLASLQKGQIAKTAGGNALISGGALSNGVHIRAAPTSTDPSPVMLEFTRSLAKSGVLGEPGSPQRMMPFQEFYSMFREFSAATDAGATAQEETETASNAAVADVSPAKSVGSRVAEGSKRRNTTTSHRSSATASTQPSAQDPSVATEPTLAPVNIVKQLAEQDPNFDAYMRVADRDEPELQRGAASRSAANLLKPRRLRKVAPLGQDALHLKDSRGRTSKDSLKGFKNHFRGAESAHSVAGSHGYHRVDEDEDGEDDDKLKSDDLLGRLKAMDVAGGGSSSSSSSSSSDGDDDSCTEERQTSPSSSHPGTAHSARGRIARSRTRGRNMQSFTSRPKQPLLTEDAPERSSWLADEDRSAAHEMQDKLRAVWDCLQVPTHTRISFMRKYSSEAYSAEMARAIDLWAEGALFVLVLLELTRCLKKVRSGLFIIPFQCSKLFDAFKAKIPPLLTSTAQSLVPPSLDYSDRSAVPLSVAAARRVKSLAESAFRDRCESRVELQVHEPAEAADLLLSIVGGVAAELTASYKRTLAELDDVLFFGSRPVREWLGQLGLQEGHSGGQTGTKK